MSDYLHEFAEEFRLIDVEGVVLDNPNDFIIIREPDGFDEIDITLMRDRSYHGFSFEFADPEKKYGFDFNVAEGETISSRELLQNIFDAKGSNGKAIFEYRTLEYGVPTLEIRSKIEFETYARKYESIEFATSRDNLGTIVNNRFDTKINLLENLGLDGNSLTDLSAIDVYTHSLLFQLSGELSNQNPNGNFLFPGFRTVERFPDQAGNDYVRQNEVYFLAHPLERVTNELEVFSYQAEMIYAPSSPNDLNGFFLFNCPDDGTYEIEYVNPISQVQSYFQNTFNDGGDTGTCELFYKINESGTPVSLGTVSGVRDDEPNTGEQGYRYDTYTLQGSLKLTLERGDNVYFYTFYEHNQDDGLGNPRRRRWRNNCFFNTPTSNDLPSDTDYGLFKIFALTSAPTTKTKAYRYFEAINRVLEAITNTNDTLVSPFFDRIDRGADSDGGGANNVMTNGFLLRQFDNSKGVRLSFEEIIKHLQAVFGVGFQVNETTVLIQKYNDFYADKQILKLENAYNININFDEEYSWNKINIGFEKYIEGDEFDRVNTLDEFHTEHEYSLPLRSIKNELDLLSPVIMSGYLIELTRRLSFAETVSESWKYDDNIFGIAVIKYTKIEAGDEVDQLGRINLTTLQLEGNFKFLENESMITIVGGDYAGTYNIIQVTVSVDETSDLIETFIETDGDFSGTPSVSTGRIDFSGEYIVSEKQTPFDQIDGVISPSTVYNARHNIKSMLYNQAPLINSGLNYNDGAELIKNQFFVNNGDAKFQFRAGQAGNTLDPDLLYKSQKDDLLLNELNQFNRSFKPLLIDFEVPLTYPNLRYIKEALLNQNSDDVNFGYIAIDNEFGEEIQLYVTELKYNPRSAQAQIVGIIKS